MPSAHHIRRHTLDLHFRGVDTDGPRARAAAGEWQREVWMPLLERVLSEEGPAGDTIILDRLEIDLTGLSPAEWASGAEGVATERLRAAVRRQLDCVVERTGPAANRALDAVVYYLQTGALPWWAPQAVTVDGPGAWLRVWIDGADDAALAHEVVSLVCAAAARVRLAAEISDEQFWRLANALTAGQANRRWSGEYNRCKDALARAGVSAQAFCTACRAAVFEDALQMPDAARSISRSREHLLAALDEDTRTALAPHQDDQPHRTAGASQLEGREPAVDPASGIQAADTLLTDALLMLDEPPHSVPTDDNERIHTHYIANAGAVLLVPFLPAFFARLGVAENRRITDAARAAVLLHCLVWSRSEYSEHSLLLPKILCGLEPTAVVASGAVVLRQEELEEADALLRAMIEHWSVLKNTSPEGLRASFLQREGRLTEKSENWRLLVHPAAHDVLLQHLPWSIGIIKLPWMRAPVFVDWE